MQESPTKRSLSNTRRSSVSKAFNNGPTQETSSVGSNTSAGASKQINVQTVGTIVNPAATAAELLSKSPSLHKRPSSPASTSAVKTPSGTFPTSLKGTGTSMTSTKRSPGSRSLPKSPRSEQAAATAGPSATQQALTGENSASAGGGGGGGGTAQTNSPMHQHQQTGSSSETNPDLLRSNVGHGLVDVTMRTGAIIQISFSVLAFLLFFSLWIYMLAYAKCYWSTMVNYLMKVCAVSGWISSAFIIFHSCFERKVTNRGVYGCIIFFILAVVTFANILLGFLALNCICRCSQGTNAWSVKSIEDLTIFGLSLAGALCFIVILLVASVVHE